ncbi:MAG TPA: hypothetical protein VK698_12895 [Kofleriaceae bacterium]|nr:hypothetical protein [Kofleriaceae bacterium]
MVNFRRSIHARHTALLLLLIACPACPGDDDGDDDGVEDGNGDQADDSDTVDAVVGIWERTDEDGAPRDRYVFNEEGTFTFDELSGEEGDDHVTGTYSADDGEMTMIGADPDSPGVTSRAEITFHASADVLGIGSFLPDGDHDGPVGIWSSRLRGETLDREGESTGRFGSDGRLELGEDGSAELGTTAFDGTIDESLVGTWTELDDGRIQIALELEDITVSTTFDFLDGAALSDVTFDRAGGGGARAARRAPAARAEPWFRQLRGLRTDGHGSLAPRRM